MTSLLKSSLNGLSGSFSEAVAEGAGRATGEMASGEGARRDPEVVAIARRRQFSGSEKRRDARNRQHLAMASDATLDHLERDEALDIGANSARYSAIARLR